MKGKEEFPMGFFDKIRASFARFMSGRYGIDNLGHEMVIAALVMTVIGALTRFSLLTLLADALILLALFRMFSKNRYKRAAENTDYLQRTQKVRKAMTEWLNRVKNGKKYRYFTCPQCKKRLRVPRGVGKITITCRDCGAKFDKKA